MTNTNKTVAERLREKSFHRLACKADVLSVAACGEKINKCNSNCEECIRACANTLADMIEAEQAELRERVDECNNTFIDLAALELLCEKLECGDANHRATAAQIRKAMKPMKPQLPEGIEWPRFEDGELVKFGDEVFIPERDKAGKVDMLYFQPSGFLARIDTEDFWSYSTCAPYGTSVKRPEPEVLDADGVPIKVGDTVWYGRESECMVLCITRYDGEVFIDLDLRGTNWNMGGVKPSEVTHRKPDTQEDIDADLKEAFLLAGEQVGDTIWLNDTETLLDRVEFILERQRKLMGGE